MRYTILNKKEARRFIEQVNERFSSEFSTDDVIVKTNRDRVILARKEMFDLQIQRANSFGLYFAELVSGMIRLSIEGSQLVGPTAKRNVIDLDDREMFEYSRGENITNRWGTLGFVIVRHGNDFFGTGKATPNSILNYMPKERRVRSRD